MSSPYGDNIVVGCSSCCNRCFEMFYLFVLIIATNLFEMLHSCFEMLRSLLLNVARVNLDCCRTCF